MDTSKVREILGEYDGLTSKLAELEAEMTRTVAERSNVVRNLATATAPRKRIRHNGQELTIVVDGGKSKNSCFLRGPRTERKDDGIVDLDNA